MWDKRLKAKINKQFEVDMRAFIASGLKRESVFDIEINKDIKKKAELLRKEANKARDVELYIIECINVDICPACGESTEEVSCPRKPGSWDTLKKCTKCAWQLILADLSID